MLGTDSIFDETVGFIDVGTNSVHLLVVHYYKGSMGTTVYQDKESLRIGKSLYSEGRISEKAIEKAALVVKGFVETSRSKGADKVIAMATCAAREAVNGDDLIDALRASGADVSVITGLEEARMIRLGVFGDNAPGLYLDMDIGGGSTEMIVCKGKEDLYLDSLALGAVRLAFNSKTRYDGPVPQEDYDMIRREAGLRSYHAVNRIRMYRIEKAFGSSGTLIALAEICAGIRGDGNASYLDLGELHSLMSRLISMDADGRMKAFGINRSRADIIIPGGAIAEELMSNLNIERLEISQNGLKQGMQIDYLIRHGHSDFDLRSSSVRTLAGRCGYDSDHADTVRKCALALFDSLGINGTEMMKEKYRELLGYACILHDIGEFINYSKHHVHSYILIMNSILSGISEEEKHLIALMARFHHKKFPKRDYKLFDGMGTVEIDAVLRCAMFLKLGDILDRRHNSAVRDIGIDTSDGKLNIIVSTEEDMSMSVWKLQTVESEVKDVLGYVPAIKVKCPE